ncbi:hypothetical protein [Paraburkholderia hospita]|jgi:hypothetical protein|uniref:Uncharacterized protein n=1 Tax=Paraburkholderia hospita TaxID=169430 RepID=A0AAN1JB17_9BURK|nr:hypothetical protein [Paraburkholderia hospita]AUT70745.1 hypothetical protein C2L64_20425 [Paraburkholderia hospita]EIM95868.1 hypothetical protein WQE_36952 [Paraburkholderia hospita]OUL69400.1 hypothetical protein CA601_49310 [Paraburkholderia hospita]OUL77594.1 hypothetical protein CA602_32840 [Paraburkholderia hospita]OUL93380.1 hypothetical protein CA603_12705 [Paraburkholderia hospita]
MAQLSDLRARLKLAASAARVIARRIGSSKTDVCKIIPLAIIGQDIGGCPVSGSESAFHIAGFTSSFRAIIILPLENMFYIAKFGAYLLEI